MYWLLLHLLPSLLLQTSLQPLLLQLLQQMLLFLASQSW
jgi:hypothetical protein